MVTGEAYIDSPAKRVFELSVISASSPLLLGVAAAGAAAAALQEGDLHVLHDIDRARYPGDQFTVKKLGDPYDNSPMLVVLRKAMVDEVPQVADVVQGTMSLCAPRADHPDHLEQLFDALHDTGLARDWEYVRRAQKAGMLSTYAVYSHSRNLSGRAESARFKTYTAKTKNARRRAMDDIEDFENTSLKHDATLLLAAAAMARTNYGTYAKRFRTRLADKVR